MTIIDRIYNYDTCWQMSIQERASILYLLSLLPEKRCAVEIGSYTGGFLAQLEQEFDQVISIDLDHRYLDRERFTKPVLISGDSRVVLPEVIHKLTKNATFFLIDGNHEYSYVKLDLWNVLKFSPNHETIILLHDSWYPPTRKAILDTRIDQNPHVHFVDLDFCIGTRFKDYWVGGLCLIHMLPTVRTGNLEIRQSDHATYKHITGS